MKKGCDSQKMQRSRHHYVVYTEENRCPHRCDTPKCPDSDYTSLRVAEASRWYRSIDKHIGTIRDVN